MKIGVVADTHGNVNSLREALRRLKGLGTEVFVHLGDGLEDAALVERDEGYRIEKIPGNNETQNDLAHERLFKWGETKVLAVHGHRYNLNPYLPKNEYMKALEGLAGKARAAGAQMALFAHTHVKEDMIVGGVRLLNPGALDLGTAEKSCLLVELSARRCNTRFLTVA